MALQLGQKSIKTVWVIDDDPDVRATYEYSLEDLQLVAVNQSDPLPDLATLLTSIKADAAICDHHLTPHNYSTFNGARLVAQWYDVKFPAILCTKVEGALDEIRPFRRRIPVLLKEPGLNPDVLRLGFERCVAELTGQFSPTRRGWRTLVRVIDVDLVSTTQTVYVVVPSWDSKREIRLQLSELPDHVQKVAEASKRLHAVVNTGAESHEDLYFDDWEDS